MGWIRDIVVVAILVLGGLLGYFFYAMKQSNLKRIKAVQKSRNLLRAQLDIAVGVLETEESLGNSNCELALMDIKKLQREYDEQRELTG